MVPRAGFIGLGNIGKPMARRLVAGGLETAVFDVVPAAVEELGAAGARRAASPRDVAATSDVIALLSEPMCQRSWSVTGIAAPAFRVPTTPEAITFPPG